MDTVLDISDLTLQVGAFRPVSNLDLRVRRNQTLAVVGESGSGKSMTALAAMRLLPGAMRIAGGEIKLLGQSLITATEKEMQKKRGKQIAMIFQEPMTSLNPVLSIGAQIVEVLRRHEALSRAAARTRAIELLDMVRFPQPGRRIDAFPHELSGGMRQRVMIAMAVACRPDALIADEPTTALDVTTQAQILSLLDQLRQELSCAVLLISHDLALVGQWAQDVVVMYAGRVVEQAPANILFAAPRHPYTKGLLAASPHALGRKSYREARLMEIPGSIQTAQNSTGCPFQPRCSLARPSCGEALPPMIRVGESHLMRCPVALETGS